MDSDHLSNIFTTRRSKTNRTNRANNQSINSFYTPESMRKKREISLQRKKEKCYKIYTTYIIIERE